MATRKSKTKTMFLVLNSIFLRELIHYKMYFIRTYKYSDVVNQYLVELN